MDAGDRQAHDGTEVKLELAQVGGVTQGYHTRIVWTWTQLREDDFALLAQEELYAPKSGTGKGLGDFGCYVLGLLQGFLWKLEGLPTLTIIAAFLYVADWWAEEGRAVFLCDGEERELRIEVDEFFDNHFLDVATAFLHGFLVCFYQLVVVVNIALSVTAGTHQWLHYAWEADLVGCVLKLLEGLGIEILGCAQSQFLGCQVADGTAIHGVVDGAC